MAADRRTIDYGRVSPSPRAPPPTLPPPRRLLPAGAAPLQRAPSSARVRMRGFRCGGACEDPGGWGAARPPPPPPLHRPSPTHGAAGGAAVALLRAPSSPRAACRVRVPGGSGGAGPGTRRRVERLPLRPPWPAAFISSRRCPLSPLDASGRPSSTAWGAPCRGALGVYAEETSGQCADVFSFFRVTWACAPALRTRARRPREAASHSH